MNTATFGTNAVDWEERIRFDRLRDERLARLKAELDALRPRRRAGLRLLEHPLHVLDPHRHLGDGQADPVLAADPQLGPDRLGLRLGREAPPALQPVARRRRPRRWTPTRTPRTTARSGRGSRTAPGPASRPSAVRSTPPPASPTRWRGRSSGSWRSSGCANEPLGVDVIELPILFALQKAGIDVVDGQQVFLQRPADQDRRTRSPCSPRRPRWSMPHTTGSTSSCARACARTRPSASSPRCCYDLGSEYVEGVNAISGERCSPHPHVYSDRIIRPGDPAFFDILHSFNGYRTCYYRTFAVGSASPAQNDAYKRAREYMDRAIALVRPGATTADIVERLADRAGVRLPRRGGGVRPAVRPRRRPLHLGEADLLPAGLARPPGGARGGDVLRPRDLLAERRRHRGRADRGGGGGDRRRMRGRHQVPGRGPARRRARATSA